MGATRRSPKIAPDAGVHFGDDRPDMLTQSQCAHGRLPADDDHLFRSSKPAGVGALALNTHWNKPNRCNPLHGGQRGLDAYDRGIQKGMQFGRSQSASAIIMEAHVRNPVLGHHTPLERYGAAAAHSTGLPSSHVVAQANATLPKLRSLGALRPHI